jgi:Family of unknown function (DUF5996)
MSIAARAVCTAVSMRPASRRVEDKLAVALAPPESQLQHAALRLTARGWETAPLPAPDGSSALVVALDLRHHVAVVEHSDGRSQRIPLTPDCAVANVTREVLAAAGDPSIDMTPHEVPWTVPLDEDREHAAYDAAAVTDYFIAATRAAQVVTAYRAPFRGRSMPVNAWWGSFDLAVSLFSGRPAQPPSNDFIMRNSMDVQEVAVGWWPGDTRYPRAPFYAHAYPTPMASRMRRSSRRPRGRRSPRHRARLRSVRLQPWFARCATGTPRWRPAPRENLRRSPDSTSECETTDAG